MSRLALRSLLCWTALGLALLLVAAGCDSSVRAVKPSDQRVYSLYGALDPARDTQWVRVEPIAEPTSEGAPRTLDATVTLENLDTGREWTLHDSLMVVQTEPQHNFWTAAPIEPSTSYELVARRSDGAQAHATTTTPAHPPTITSLRDTSTGSPRVLIQTDKLAALKLKFYWLGRVFEESYYQSARKRSGGYVSSFTPQADIDDLGLLRVDSIKVLAAVGGPDWPPWEVYHGAPVGAVTLPDSFSNVDGGLGRVAGVYSTTAPLR